METQRTSIEVWDQLLHSLRTTVTELHPSVQHTPFERTALIDGTAVFPGGSGLWRGVACHGPLPTHFPAKPVLFVAHNFDKVAGFERSRRNGGEGGGPFWRHLQLVLQEAQLQPDDCFFTNLLMGLQPTKATGRMPSTPEYLKQCVRFFQRQLDIVSPRLIVGLGEHVHAKLRSVALPVSYVGIKHPSALLYVSAGKRNAWIADEAQAFRSALSAAL